MPVAAVHIAQSLQRGLDSLIGFIPNLVGCLIILFVGYVIARLVKAAVTKVLEAIGLDRVLGGSQAGAYVERVSPGARPSRLVGVVAFWLIFIYAIAAAVGALKIPALTNLNQLKIAPEIVTVTYVALIGMLAVAGALAFGLGGRQLAADMMRDAYDSSREDRPRPPRTARPDAEPVER